ncbi:hypothetical protein MMYC01_201327 [Madurella mycetomatis]|uniref:Uncharacterized protein n=1 Tax=Madurella mycetomatis TaxID=100816 RepID=A0A175WF69_9PEZI|nr:hypothetical protein MMYC01_201327 [Madurella mycetomatis]
MEVTNACLSGYHHGQMVSLMKAKVQDLLDYQKTKNRKILHLDWIAGNPSDPVNGGGCDSGDGVSSEERGLRNSVANIVMRYVHGVQHLDQKEAWNKSMFFGDWLNNSHGERQFFLEIQVKRISGADNELQEKCGIHSQYAWLPLHNDKAKGVDPAVFPPLRRQAIPALMAVRSLGIPQEPGFSSVAEEEEPPAAPPSLQSLKSSADRSKGRAVPYNEGNDVISHGFGIDLNHQEPATVAASSPYIPSIGNLALGPANGSAAGLSPARTVLPRSLPFPQTGGFNPIDSSSQNRVANEPGDSGSPYADEGSVVFFDNINNPYIQPTPSYSTPAGARDDPVFQAQVLAVNQAITSKADELRDIFAFDLDRDFLERKAKSFIYAVRVVAIPDPGYVTNSFTGPAAPDRNGTLLAQGGWVVPPIEERAACRASHKRAYRNKGAKSGKYEGPLKPEVNRAMPIEFDWSNQSTPRYFGEALPIWREPVDPCLEDVYWMVSQLLSGKQFAGMRTGFGFGIPRTSIEGDEQLLAECRFKSPSPETVYHAASYPRGNESKK